MMTEFAARGESLDPQMLAGLRVAIVGAAREGTALVRYLVRHGAQVTLSDSKPAEALEKTLSAIQGLDVRLALGGNPPDLLDVDVLFLSPGVPPSAAIVRQARERGVPISSEPRLFTQLCRAPVVGITGSSGKSTTTALTGRMYDADGCCVWVGGNIGAPLLERMLEDGRPDVAVMELSSFQLELFSPDYQGEGVDAARSAASRVVSVDGWSPPVAAITNITPNHLDRHPSMDDYIQAKTQILNYQRGGDWAVLNRDNSVTRGLLAGVRGRALAFSLEEPVDEGACLQGDALVLRLDGREQSVCRMGDLLLRGRHNVANTLTAICLAAAGGVSVEAMCQAATTFAGVPHRLEVVREREGVLWVNDSIATSPERAMAALRAFSEPLVLLAGGRDKHLPWEEWADLAMERTRAVVAFGDAVPIIRQALEGARARGRGGANNPVLREVATLDDAVEHAADLARAGDVVLLSPGGTSFDAFGDFEARGERFRDLVTAL